MLSDLYTSLEEAEDEIWHRWKEPKLREEVAMFVGGVPECFLREPRAILNRDVATPDFEFKEFLKKAQRINLKPIVVEYSEDKFVGFNPDKRALAKMAIFRGNNRNGDTIFHYRTIIDFAASDGKGLSEIKTRWGESLFDFHHGLLAFLYPDVEVVDNAKWLTSRGSSAREFYVYELSLCICHGVLFENFLPFGKEESFCEDVVRPAVDRIVSLFGCKPIIVPLISSDDEDRDVNDIYWSCYPSCFDREILGKLLVKGHEHMGISRAS